MQVSRNRKIKCTKGLHVYAQPEIIKLPDGHFFHGTQKCIYCGSERLKK